MRLTCYTVRLVAEEPTTTLIWWGTNPVRIVADASLSDAIERRAGLLGEYPRAVIVGHPAIPGIFELASGIVLDNID